jgi:hypothetical protein
MSEGAAKGVTQAPELLLPEVKGRLGDPGLPTDIADRRAGFGQAQRVGDLLFGVARFLHRFSSPQGGRRSDPTLLLRRREKLGQRQLRRCSRIDHTFDHGLFDAIHDCA